MSTTDDDFVQLNHSSLFLFFFLLPHYCIRIFSKMANDQSSTTRPLLSLTTIYTPPPTCSQIITSSGELLWQGGMFQTGDVNCFPPSFSQIVGSAYSPGVCPHGWTVEFTLWATASAETAVYCCPR